MVNWRFYSVIFCAALNLLLQQQNFLQHANIMMVFYVVIYKERNAGGIVLISFFRRSFVSEQIC